MHLTDRADTLSDMRIAQAADGKIAKKHHEEIMKFAL